MNPDLLFRYLMGSFGAACAAIFFLKALEAWRTERREREARCREAYLKFWESYRERQERRMRGSARLGLLFIFACASAFWGALAFEMHRIHASAWRTFLAVALFWLLLALAQLVWERTSHAG